MRREALACAALCAVTLAVYLPVRHYGFIPYDDPLYIDHPRVQRGLTLDNIAWAFTTRDAANYHPLTWLSHMLDVQLFGKRPGPMHVVNVVMHAGNALLLFVAFAYMTGAFWRPLGAAALFALHPLRVESVAWIAERKDVLCALLFLLAVWAYGWYARQRTRRRYAVVFGATLLALLAKPMAVTLPAVLLLLDFWPLRRWPQQTWRALAAEKLPLVALVILSAGLTIYAQERAGAVQDNPKFSLANRVANAPVSYVRYVGKTIWPARLAVFYPHPGRWPAWRVIAATLAVVAATGLSVRLARRAPYAAVGWLWFVGTLLPVIGIVQAGVQSMADRYTYIPTMGLCILIAWAVGDASRLTAMRYAAAPMAMAVLVALAWATSRQLRYWTGDPLALFGHALDVTDDNWLAHGYVGSALINRGRAEQGRYHLQRAMQLNPSYPEIHYNWGNLMLGEGRFDDAARSYAQALRLRPTFAEALSQWAIVLASQGRRAEAEEKLREAVRLRPDYADAQANLGKVLAMQGRHREAIVHYRRALELRPGLDAAQRGLEESREALGGEVRDGE